MSNRIAMAPMTRSRADPQAVPSPYAAQYYAQRASAGIIISEAIGISAQSVGYPRTPGIWTGAQQAAWREITRAVRAREGRMIAQLWHVGRVFSTDNNPEGLVPLAPSAVAAQGEIYTLNGLVPLPEPRAMSLAQVAATVEDFATAAEAALAVGFDGVEIHGANGYLVEQFLSDQTNRRDDVYGGSTTNRLRFLSDVLDAIATRCEGLSRIGLRLSPFGDFNGLRHTDPAAAFVAAADLLESRGGAYLHVIEPGVSGDGDSHRTSESPDVLTMARTHFSGPLVTAGGYDRARAEDVLAAGRADMIAFGRPYISNPDLAERLRQGVALSDWESGTFYTKGPRGYVDYPAATDQNGE